MTVVRNLDGRPTALPPFRVAKRKKGRKREGRVTDATSILSKVTEILTPSPKPILFASLAAAVAVAAPGSLPLRGRLFARPPCPHTPKVPGMTLSIHATTIPYPSGSVRVRPLSIIPLPRARRPSIASTRARRTSVHPFLSGPEVSLHCGGNKRLYQSLPPSRHLSFLSPSHALSRVGNN